MNEFKSWEEMSVLEQYAAQYWDMYKDAYGVRPRGIDTSGWTEEEFRAEFARLGEVINREIAAERAAQDRASHDFETRVQMLISAGAKNRPTALRWIHEAEDTCGDNEYLCFKLGLPYNYFRDEEIEDPRAYAERSADLDAVAYGQ